MPPGKRNSISKWQIASAKITDLRWQIQNALVDNFTEEDMNSEKYKQLMDTVNLLMDHVLEKHRKEKEKKRQQEMDKLKKKASLFSWRNGLVALVSGVLGGFGDEIGTWFFSLIKTVFMG